ncbi:MAG: outer membrane lipoprotein-sorting protein [FCB group bacterium]|nr:outer membrane lipoprotein-sorting protein [FCB group bacterium]
MKNATRYLSASLLVLALFAASAFAAYDATAIMKKSHLSYYYAGNDGITEVNMTLTNKRGKERKREFTMLRLDLKEGGKQDYYTYFRKPSDVARLTFMVHKIPDGNDLRWIYIPSIDLVKPISADDKNSSFVGSDFTYEDVSGRHWTEDNHTFKGVSQLNGKPVFVIESVPKKPYKGFAKKISYIDTTNYLPLKEEYFNKRGKMIRLFTANKIETIDGIPTVMVRTMENLKKGSKTTVAFSKISYNVGLNKGIFTERYLKNPPRKYIK